MKSGVSRAQANKAIRQEALREQLSNQKHVEHVIELIKKVQDFGTDLDALQIQRVKIAIDARMKLVGKYLPDLKAMELSGEVSNGQSRDSLVEEIVTMLSGAASGHSESTDRQDVH